MADRRIPRDEWQSFFDRISKSFQDENAEMEVAGLDFGDQIQEEWTPLEGLSFDPKVDSIFVHTEALDHQIRRPAEVIVSEKGAITLTSVTVRDEEGRIHTVRLRHPLQRLTALHEKDEASAGAP